MLTLPDPKHEAFATLRASGHDVASAYVHAGYSVKNIKQRSRKLLKNPAINARIEYLKTCLPRITKLHQHHCPTLLLMPETRHEMLVWLWQVMNGTRLIKPAQMRAATLYCRLQGWHLAKLLPQAQTMPGEPTPDAADQSPIPTSTLTEVEKGLLAISNQENIAQEPTGLPRSPENLARYQSTLANLAHPDAKKDPFGRPLPDEISQSTEATTPTLAASPVSSPTSNHPSIHQSPASAASNNPPTHPSPASTPSQNPRPVNPANPAILSKNPQPESPQTTAPITSVRLVSPARPVLSSPSPSKPPVNPANPVILSKNPQPIPHPKQLILNSLPQIPPQPRTFFLSSKAAPTSAGPSSTTSRLNLPPRKFPRPLVTH